MSERDLQQENLIARLSEGVASPLNANELPSKPRPDITNIIDNPINSEAALVLESPELVASKFESYGFPNLQPLPVATDRIKTTVFVTAGVQVLEGLVQNGETFEPRKFFVAQPSTRTQFTDSVGEGTSTSFVNLSTEIVDPSIEEHFAGINTWLSFLEELGIGKDRLQIIAKTSSPSWGERSMENYVLKFYCKGLEIGDAIYIYNLHNGKRKVTISDIGFGLERITWLLRGGSYFGLPIASDDQTYYSSLDSAKTLALILGSGVKPSHKAQGFRARMFSKRLVDTSVQLKIDPHVMYRYYNDYWAKWVPSFVGSESSLATFNQEHSRNFNRLLLNRLGQYYKNIDIDINYPTPRLVKLLKGTEVNQEHLFEILTEMGYKV